MTNRLSLLIFAIISLVISLAASRPGLAQPLFSSPIPAPSGGEAIWCTDSEVDFTPGPGTGEVSFVATITNMTSVTTPTSYPLDIPENRVYVGVWQEQRRRRSDTGFLLAVPPIFYGQSATVSGTFTAPASGTPIRYYLRLWDSIDRVWSRDVCEPPAETVKPPPAQSPPPVRTAPISGTWQTDYDPIPFAWDPPTLAAGVEPVLDYDLEVIWGDGIGQSITTTLTGTTVTLPAATDQSISWRVRARNNAGYGRWTEPGWVYGIDATPPTLTPLVEANGTISGVWQNHVSIPIFTWTGSDPPGGSGLAAYLRTWMTGLPCVPAATTITPTFSISTPASGINYLCVLARDVAGNESGLKSFEFRYDPPGVSAALDPATATVYPGQVITYVTTITNDSLAADTFTPTLRSGDWPASGLPSVLKLPGKGSADYVISLTVPAGTVAGTIQTVPLTVTGQAGVSAGQSFTATVNRPDALQVAGASALVRRPAEPATYTLVLSNGSAATTTFDLSTASAWPVSIPDSVTVDPLKSVSFAVAMPPPAGAWPGEVNEAVITARVHDYPAITVQAVITGIVSRPDNLVATPDTRLASSSSGNVTYTLTLTNGSTAADTFDLKVTSSWPVSLPAAVTVAGGGSQNFTLTMFVPGGVQEGVIKTATITATSRANGVIKLTKVITAVIGRVDRLKVTLLPAAKVLATQETGVIASATLWTENLSNYRDDLVVSTDLPAAWSGGVAAPLTFSLDPLAGRLNTLSLSIPDTVSSGVYRVPITVTGRYEQVTVEFEVALINQPKPSHVYLPIIFGGSSPLPDLVGAFKVSAGPPVQVTATVNNIGDAPAGDFWVDFYVDPAMPPGGPNQPWDYLCSVPAAACQGIAWYVSTSIPPGGLVTLSSNSGYVPANTRWSGNLSGAHRFYLFVDSWNPTMTSGAVIERDESNNRSEQRLLLSSGLAGQTLSELFEPVTGRMRWPRSAIK